DERVGCGEEHTHKVLRRAVRRRVEKDQQQHTEEEVNSSDADEPGPLAPVQLEEENKRHQGKERIYPIDPIDKSDTKNPQLRQENQRVINNITSIGFFILTASEGMDDPFHGPWIAPLHRRVAHARQRHVEIKRGS